MFFIDILFYAQSTISKDIVAILVVVVVLALFLPLLLFSVTSGIAARRSSRLAASNATADISDTSTGSSSSNSPSLGSVISDESSNSNGVEYDIECGLPSTNDGAKKRTNDNSNEDDNAKRARTNDGNDNDDDNNAEFDFDVPTFSLGPSGDNINLEESGEEGQFKEVKLDDIDGLDDADAPHVNQLFKFFARDEEDKTLIAEVISHYYVLFLFFNPGTAFTVNVIVAMMMTMIQVMTVFVVYFSRGMLASGRNWLRLRSIIMKGNDFQYFKLLVYAIESIAFVLRGFINWNLSGVHEWHMDTFRPKSDYRGILSMLCSVKIMWFRDIRSGRQFGVYIPHGAFVVLSRVGAGVVGPLRHKVTGAKGSFIGVFEFGMKKKQ